MNKLKHDIAVILDDNLHTRKWHNYADYLIIAMILICAIELFISTFNISPELRRILWWIDIITLIFFTIEVTLRILVAPVINPKYRGFKGRIKYCLTFHGFIDVIATYPYYLQWVIPFPITWIKILRLSRVMRLFRISRYMKSWRMLTGAIAQKKQELLISLQFLIIVTFILSLILFFCEHDSQPDVYDNGFSSVLWAFAQYIGDPGGFGDTPPVSVIGKIIASIVGILGIAIFAVPAGILGAGFTEAIEEEKEKETLAANRRKLYKCFERKLDRPTGFQAVKPYMSIIDLQTRSGLAGETIVNVVEQTPGYRLINLAATRTIDKFDGGTLAVEHFAYNRSYGLMIDRKSPITIIAPSSFIDPCTGFFAYYLAKIGGFNYISREFGEYAPYRSYYLVNGDIESKEEADYFADVEKLLNHQGAWSVTMLAASGANEPEYDTQIHFGTGNPKGNEETGDLIKDKKTYEDFYHDVAAWMLDEFDIKIDNGKYHNTASPKLFLRNKKITASANHIVMRVAWSAMLWDPRRLKIAQSIAECLNRDILHLDGNPDDPQLKQKDFGYK